MQSTVVDAEALGRTVTAQIAPDELGYIEIVTRDFRRDPSQQPSDSTTSDPLGIGIELSIALSPLILWLSQVAVDALQKQVEGVVENQVQIWFEKTLRRLGEFLRIRKPLKPAQVDVSNFSIAEIRRVRELVLIKAAEIETLSQADATRIADAISGALVAQK